jgi:hypothetical protein
MGRGSCSGKAPVDVRYRRSSEIFYRSEPVEGTVDTRYASLGGGGRFDGQQPHAEGSVLSLVRFVDVHVHPSVTPF